LSPILSRTSILVCGLAPPRSAAASSIALASCSHPHQKLRDRIKCGVTLAEIAVKYDLHKTLRTQAPSLRDSLGVQVEVFKAYVGGLFREQGLDVVKEWLNPLFRPRIEDAYQAESRDHLVPSSPPPPSTAPSPSPPGGAIETQGRTNLNIHARLRSRTTRNSSAQTPRVASPRQREADRPNSKRKRQATLRDGGSGDADAPDSQHADRPTSASPQRSPATAGTAERSMRKRRRSR